MQATPYQWFYTFQATLFFSGASARQNLQRKNKTIMKQLTIITATIVSLFFASCSKSKDEPAPLKGELQLVKMTTTYTGQSPVIENLSYDVQGKLLTYSSSDNGTVYNFDYSGSNALVVKRILTSNQQLDLLYNCTLNHRGYITAMEIKKADGTLILTRNITYDNEGYLTKYKDAYSNSTYETVYTRVNGNVVSYKIFYNGIQEYSGSLSYDLAKKASPEFPYHYYWPSKSLFGKPQTNLLKEFRHYNKNNQLTVHNQYLYEWDGTGRVSKSIMHNITNNKQEVTEYTYQ